MGHVTSLMKCIPALTICLTAAAPRARAATLFLDGSENSIVDAVPATTDPTVGVWDFHYNFGTVMTRTGAAANGPSAAYAGSNYLEVARGPDTADLGAVLEHPVNATTDDLHAELRMWMKNYPGNSNTIGFLNAYEYASFNNPDSYLVSFQLSDRDGTGMRAYYHNGLDDSWGDTGLSLTDSDWNAIAMDWNHATGKFTIGINGSTPFEIPTAGIGFATLIDRLQWFPAGGGAGAFYDNVLIQDSTVVLLPGDVNFDGIVNIFDINLVSSHWGETGPVADANGDMIVNIFDINLISSNWTPSAGAAAAVPEPATFALLAWGAVMMSVRLVSRCRARS